VKRNPDAVAGSDMLATSRESVAGRILVGPAALDAGGTRRGLGRCRKHVSASPQAQFCSMSDASAKPTTAEMPAVLIRQPGPEPSGLRKAAVLSALAGGEAMTASEVAKKARLARPTVSTTLSKLVKSGELQKAERGYRLASAGWASRGRSIVPVPQ
jgi:hypothetical protein